MSFMPLPKSPCKNCPYRENNVCTLLNLKFPSGFGVKKCYTIEGNYDEFYRDLIRILRKESPLKAKTLAKSLGISINRATHILLTLKRYGIVVSEKPSKTTTYYRLRDGVTRGELAEIKEYLRPIYENFVVMSFQPKISIEGEVK